MYFNSKLEVAVIICTEGSGKRSRSALSLKNVGLTGSSAGNPREICTDGTIHKVMQQPPLAQPCSLTTRREKYPTASQL